MRALVLFSGGIDSTTCLALAIKKYGKDNVIALSVHYGQKHSKEIESANSIVKHYDVEWITLDLTNIFTSSNSSLLQHSDREIPMDIYGNQLKENKIISTYVPFRNGLFLSVAASIALSKECEVIYYGAHTNDAEAAYPDCTEEFNRAISNAILYGSGGKLKIIAPFITHEKRYIVSKGLKLKVPYELTWSCYEGKDKPCGKCGTCLDRKMAFKLNGIKE